MYSSADAETHCSPDEKVMFSCSTGNMIFASVCASNDLSKTSGYIQYRFGRIGSPELVVPETTSIHPSKVTSGNIIKYSGNSGTFLRFTNREYGYVIYRGKDKDVPKEGIALESNGKIITNLWCLEKAVNEIDIKKLMETGIVPEDKENSDCHKIVQNGCIITEKPIVLHY
jgi:hypothetical protein